MVGPPGGERLPEGLGGLLVASQPELGESQPTELEASDDDPIVTLELLA